MKQFRLHDAQDHVTSEALEAGSRLAKKGSVLLLVRGMTLHKDIPICIAMRDMAFNQDIKELVAKPDLDPAFLAYWLAGQKSALLGHVDSAGHGTGRLNTDTLKAMRIKVPPLDEQKRIADILGALDDKIELNRKMNETLEQMAKALFKSWFVDFDPVHAKAAGRRTTGMDKATADLFPDSFVDSELGMIPKGWNAGSLSQLSEFSRESINPGESPSEIFDHYSLPSFDEGKAPKAEAGSEIKSNKLVVTKKCVLLSKLNPHIPRIWLPDLSASRRSICSTEFIVASALTSCTREYLYALFISEDFSRTYGTLVTGTTGSHQRIRPESVLQMRLPVAPKKLISSFTELIAPMLDRVACNTKESQTLAELRNSLLPVLISGGQLNPKLSPA
jgi:type I restriction enzyme S subunit